MKTCFVCNEEKPDSEFYTGRNRCRSCAIANSQANKSSAPKAQECFVLSDPAAVWATKSMGGTYWQQAGEWMLGDLDEMPVS